MVISCVVIGGLIVFIASVQLIRIAVRRCNHDPNNDPDNEQDNDRDNGQDNERDNERDNDPRQNLLSNRSDDGRGFKNVLSGNPSCNITVPKKDDFKVVNFEKSSLL